MLKGFKTPDTAYIELDFHIDRVNHPVGCRFYHDRYYFNDWSRNGNSCRFNIDKNGPVKSILQNETL